MQRSGHESCRTEMGLGKDGPSWLKEDHGTTTCELRFCSRWLPPSDQQATLVPLLLLDIYSRGWDATAKVLYARIKHTRSGTAVFHAILIDQTT